MPVVQEDWEEYSIFSILWIRCLNCSFYVVSIEYGMWSEYELNAGNRGLFEETIVGMYFPEENHDASIIRNE